MSKITTCLLLAALAPFTACVAQLDSQRMRKDLRGLGLVFAEGQADLSRPVPTECLSGPR